MARSRSSPFPAVSADRLQNFAFSVIDADALNPRTGAGEFKGTIRGDGLTSKTVIGAESREIDDLGCLTRLYLKIYRTLHLNVA
jgi:hypothetical protein